MYFGLGPFIVVLKIHMKYWYVSDVSPCDSGFISCGQRKWWQISPVKEGATKGHSDVLFSAQAIPSWGGRWVTVRARLVIETCLGFEAFGTMVLCNIWEQILRLPPKQKRLYRVQKIRTRLYVCGAIHIYIYTYPSIHIHIYIYTFIFHICTYIYINYFKYICVYIYIFKCVYIYIHIIFVYIYIYTCILLYVFFLWCSA